LKKGTLVCFTGVDGCGKTTQAKMLVDHLNSIGYKTTYIWSRGSSQWGKTLIKIGRKIIGVNERSLSNNPDSYMEYQKKKSKVLFKFKLFRFIWFLLVEVEHIIKLRSIILPLLRSNQIVVCDRYLWDSIVDLAISFNESKEWVHKRIKFFLGRIIPHPKLSLFLSVSSDVAMGRKDDIPSRVYIERRIPIYCYLANSLNMIFIDGTKDSNAIKKKILIEVVKILDIQ
jgi:dTMP kinase